MNTNRVSYLLEKIGHLRALKAAYVASPYDSDVVLTLIKDLDVDIGMMEGEILQLVAALEAEILSLKSMDRSSPKQPEIWSGWNL